MLTIGWFFLVLVSVCQEIPVTAERQLEQLAVEESDLEDDQLVQQLEQYMRHKLDLNGDGADKLVAAGILTVVQANNLESYRRYVGDLIDICELQAVPGWDLATIRIILPYILVGSDLKVGRDLTSRISGGAQSVVLRVSRELPATGEYKKNQAGIREYAGSPLKIFFRYQYHSGDKLQYGITAEKDAGETFFRNNAGFDFYSAHLFLRDVGKLKSIALGDFTVNMGQGLIHWQSMAFKKSADAMNVKRQSPVLKPYNSAGEFNFLRGAGLTISFGHLVTSIFASVRKISTNHDIDTAEGEKVFTSFQKSGYHRTLSEIGDRSNTGQLTAGTVLQYRRRSLRIGINCISYRFSLPFKKADEPYNLFSIRGDNWYNLSLDLMYTWKNLHWFAEIAKDREGNSAGLAGLVASLNKTADLTLVYRNFSRAYQTISGNAFSENAVPGNEEGIYTGLTFRPGAAWKLDLYADYYFFPWLRYRVSSPSVGWDWMLQICYTPTKQVEITSRLRKNSGELNSTAGQTAMGYPEPTGTLNWRTQINFKISREITLRNRVEIVITQPEKSKGFLASTDFIYKPSGKKADLNLRMQFFDTDTYNSRIYAYENHVLYAQSVPVFSGRGIRYYLLSKYEHSAALSSWLRFSLTNFITPSNISPAQTVHINTELTFQIRYQFRLRKL
ncbi:MAG: hypothetical protein ABWZ25_10380 [Chitinophagaceae bacterium]